MSIREAAEAVIRQVDCSRVVGRCDGVDALRCLRSALSESDPMPEACEIIKRLRAYVCAGECDLRGHVLWCDRARDFLKRMEGRT